MEAGRGQSCHQSQQQMCQECLEKQSLAAAWQRGASLTNAADGPGRAPGCMAAAIQHSISAHKPTNASF